MKIGFTGTRQGMSIRQFGVLRTEFAKRATEFHHGDCIGSDAQAHEVMRQHSYAKIVLHPPASTSLRAHCPGAHESRMPTPYLSRNRAIVDETEMLIATPAEFTEQQRSGTWSTIRYARSVGKKMVIIFPDGTVS